MRKDDLHDMGAAIANGAASISAIHEFVAALLPNAVVNVNEFFSPRQLIKRSRDAEPLPIEKRQLSSYRTRIGTMLEYAISTFVDADIKSQFADDLRLTFAVAHEYPDFYVRDAVLGPRVRIEMKAVDAESDEQAARFDVLSSLIQGEKDLVVLVGWEWISTRLRNGTACEYPQIFSFVVVPASELAGERDTSVHLRGGRVEPTGILVPSKSEPGTLTEDKGNAGKILRLVHKSRKGDNFQLSKYIQQYLQFCDSVVARSKRTEVREAIIKRREEE